MTLLKITPSKYIALESLLSAESNHVWYYFTESLRACREPIKSEYLDFNVFDNMASTESATGSNLGEADLFFSNIASAVGKFLFSFIF